MKNSGTASIHTYDSLSPWYGALSNASESPLRREGLKTLLLCEGESILEIGPGTGTELPEMAKKVGKGGMVCAVDLSRGMLRQCSRSILRSSPQEKVNLLQGTGLLLPFKERTFDVVFLSFTLELFSNDDMKRLLRETLRVQRSTGRIGVISLSDNHPKELPTKIYEWFNHRFPTSIDCRPINAPGILEECGYRLIHSSEKSMWGLHVSISVAQVSMG